MTTANDELTVADHADAEVFAAEPELPQPWAMSITELDSWAAYYRTRERGLGLFSGALTAAEREHRDEVLRNINLRHEARRYTLSRHDNEPVIFAENVAEFLRD